MLANVLRLDRRITLFRMDHREEGIKMKTKKMIRYENEIIEVNIDQAYELFKGCIGKVARSFLGYSKDYEELYQISCIGFTKAFNTYKDIKVPFYSFAKLCCTTELLKNFRKKRVNTVSYNEKSCEGKEILDILEGDINLEESIYEKIDVFDSLKVLSNREREVINLTALGYSQKNIAAKFGLDQSQISRIKTKAVKKFKEQYKEVI